MGPAALAVGAVVWGLAAAGGFLVAAFGVDRLLTLLPPLTIDADAVAGAILAISLALGLAAACHLAVLLAHRRGWRGALPAGVLLCALGVAVSIGLAGTAFASAAAEPSAAMALVAAGIVGLVAAAGYAGAAAWFVRQIRSSPRAGGGV